MAKMFKGINGVALRENRPLTRTELAAVVPSVFASTAHDSRSDRFAPVPTIDVIERLEKENYFPMYAIQSKSRIIGKSEFTKHMLRLRQPGKAEGEANEIILVNANDGTSSYKLMAGQFRFVCSNGLVMGTMSHNTRIYHKGSNIMDDVIEGVYHVVNDFKEIERYKTEMQRIQLTPKEQLGMATAGYILKEGIPENEDLSKCIYNPALLLTNRNVNSTDANNNSLYSTFNKVQQHLIAGGQKSFMEDVNGRTRRRTAGAVNQIDKNINLNSKLWEVAMSVVNNNIRAKDMAESFA